MSEETELPDEIYIHSANSTWEDSPYKYNVGTPKTKYHSDPRVQKLVEAAHTLLRSEWMVTHDWGGDRDAVIQRLDKALAEFEEGK